MSHRHAFVLALLALSLGACGSSAPQQAPREEDRKLERAVQEPLDRARAVQQQMQDARKQQDAEIEDGGG
jgi:hypothetical protein